MPVELQTLLSAAQATGADLALGVPRKAASALFEVTGTFTATITWEGSADGSTWFTIPAMRIGGGSGIATTATGTGLYAVACQGLAAVRPNITAYTSGSVTVNGRTSLLNVLDGAYGGRIEAATATLDETATDWGKVLAALYGFDGTDLARLRAARGDTTSGQGALRLLSLAQLCVRDAAAGTIKPVQAASDAADGGSGSQTPTVVPLVRDGAGNFTVLRGVAEETILASATRDADTNSADQTNHNSRGVMVWFDLTAIGGTTPSAAISIQIKDPVSGGYKTAASVSGITTTGLRNLLVHPTSTDAAGNVDAENDIPLPGVWRVKVDVDTADGDETYTYSVGATYLP